MKGLLAAAMPLRQMRPSAAAAVAKHGSRRCFSVSPRVQLHYGFIGLGRIGFPMARNLRAKMPADEVLVIQDINRAVSEKFAREHPNNVRIVDEVRDLAEQSHTIISMLPQPLHVENVYKQMLEPPSLPIDKPGDDRLFIDCSTIDPATSRYVGAAAYFSGQGKFIDAPVSGGVVGAEAGTLTFMMGAEDKAVERARSVLSLMGRRVLHLGDIGAGLHGKLANNYLLAVNNIATAEAMNMGIRWGLEPKALADMINMSTGRCWPSEVNNPVPGVVPRAPASRGYESGFELAHAIKDLNLALKTAQEQGVKVALGEHARRIYEETQADERCKDKDFSVVYRYLGGKE